MVNRLECNPHDNLDDPSECRACRNHGPCEECGGAEPTQLSLADLIVAQQERVSIAAAKFYREVLELPAPSDEDAA